MSVTLKVSAQGVDAGQINSDEYDALVKNIYKDYRSHLAQLFHVVLGLFKTMANSMIMTPIVMFWVVVFIFMFDKNTTIASIYPYMSDSRAVAELFKLLIAFSWFCSFSGAIFLFNPIKNAYKKLIDSELRKRLDLKIPYGTELFIFNPDNL